MNSQISSNSFSQYSEENSNQHQAAEFAERTITLLKEYEIDQSLLDIDDSILGSGGYADVRKAKLRASLAGFQPGTVVAVKQLRPRKDTTVTLAREIAVWAGLKNRYVVRLIGFTLDKRADIAWMISTFASSGSLHGYISNMPKWQNTRTRLAIDIARGIEYLHNHSPPIRHGDIKPENILINGNDEAVLTDFGLSSAVQSDPSGPPGSEGVQGTLRYMSPELLLEEDPALTLESDIWALGCLFLEIMTDQSPYEGVEHEGALTLKIACMEPPAPELSMLQSVRSDRIRKLVSQSWSMEPEDRPSASECLAVLCSDLYGFDPDQISWDVRKGRDQHILVPKAQKRVDVSLLHTLEAERPSDVHCLTFSPNGEYLAVARENVCQVVDVQTGSLVSTYTAPVKPFSLAGVVLDQVRFSSDGHLLAAGPVDGFTHILELPSMNKRHALAWGSKRRRVSYWIAAVNSDEDGNPLIIVTGDLTVRRYDMVSGEESRLPYTTLSLDSIMEGLSGGLGELNAAAISPDGRLVFGSILDLRSGDRVESLSFVADGSLLVTGGYDQTAHSWDLTPLYANTSRQQSEEAPEDPDGSQCSVEPKVTFKEHRGSVDALVISQDGRWVVSVSLNHDDHDVRVWDPNAGKTELIVSGHIGGVRCVAIFSHLGDRSGGIIASGDWEGRARIWQFENELGR
ncbi:hypothetical protein FRC01_005138 [Tulasnella sp. 417]|nr:hypothetical protein FRC01_005138 [Tulasnella sp. 417]